MYLKNLIGHTKTILIHKYYVFLAMKDCGRLVQGIFHDLSKFSYCEFSESVKYYDNGISSPINKCREIKGYSEAWLHHKGRNKHHSSYWIDIDGKKVTPIKIPYKYVIEGICDSIGAGKTYLGRNWTCDSPLEWWNKTGTNHIINESTKYLLDFVYNEISISGWDYVSKELIKTNKLKYIYDSI